MASRLLSREFPLFPLAPGAPQYGMNMFDQTPTNLGAGTLAGGWSGGCQTITTIEKPSTIGSWRILGWGITFQGSLYNIPEPGVQPYATLPKMYAGLVRNAGLAEGPGNFTQLPPDNSNIDLVWDGPSDQPFPQAASQSPFVPGAPSMNHHSVVLPNPMDGNEEDKFQIGMWVTPMLGQNVRIWIFNATYTISYDDNPQ